MVNFKFLYSTVSTLKPEQRQRRTHQREDDFGNALFVPPRFLLPMVGMGCMNSSCLSLKRMVVFPAPSSPSVTTRISIFGPM